MPFVVEPAAGVDRVLLAFLADAYREEEVRGEKRVVLRFHPELAPVKVAVLPLLKKREEIVRTAQAHPGRAVARTGRRRLRRHRRHRAALPPAGRGGHALLRHGGRADGGRSDKGETGDGRVTIRDRDSHGAGSRARCPSSCPCSEGLLEGGDWRVAVVVAPALGLGLRRQADAMGGRHGLRGRAGVGVLRRDLGGGRAGPARSARRPLGRRGGGRRGERGRPGAGSCDSAGRVADPAARTGRAADCVRLGARPRRPSSRAGCSRRLRSRSTGTSTTRSGMGKSSAGVPASACLHEGRPDRHRDAGAGLVLPRLRGRS